MHQSKNATANNLDDFAWRFRPLVVYAPLSDSKYLAEQRAVLSVVHAALRERDIVVIEVVGDAGAVVLGPKTLIDAGTSLGQVGLPRDRFGVALVGKDTGVKLRSELPVTPERLLAIIDAMPMRQQELARGRPS